MKTDLKPMTDYLIGLGINDIEHTEKSYLAHLVAVCRGLDRWNCAEHVCLATARGRCRVVVYPERSRFPVREKHDHSGVNRGFTRHTSIQLFR